MPVVSNRLSLKPNPCKYRVRDPRSGASANSATFARSSFGPHCNDLLHPAVESGVLVSDLPRQSHQFDIYSSVMEFRPVLKTAPDAGFRSPTVSTGSTQSGRKGTLARPEKPFEDLSRCPT
jgi:hypothetical protein